MRPVTRIACLLLLGLLTTPALAQEAGAAAVPDVDARLSAAFEREKAALAVEKEELQRQLRGLEADGRSRTAKESARIGQLNRVLVELRATSRGLEEEAEELARSLDSRDSQHDLLANTLEQALDTLRSKGAPLDVADGAGSADIVRAAFAEAAQLASRWASVRREEGRFFDAEGREVEGTLLRFGQVAALGRTDALARVLMPAGEGLLAAGPAEYGDTSAIFAGALPALTPLFLFDPLAKERPRTKDSTWRDTLDKGGFLVWPIVGLAGLALLLFLERVLVLSFVGGSGRRLVRRVHEQMARGAGARARGLCEKARGAIARVLEAALQHRDCGRAVIEDAVQKASLQELRRLDRFLPTLQVIAGVAPLLGLLGTVTGMISTFDVITEHGTGDPKLLSGGISEALITTELGLMVAIPTLLLHALLSGWVERVVRAMEQRALELLVTIETRAPAPVAPEESA